MLFDRRPPYVRFEEREVGINAAATKEAGRPIPNIVNFACITPHGSKDVHEKVAEEWLEQINRKAISGEYDANWVNTFKHQYEEWKKGNDIPRDGTPIKTWAMTTKEAAKRLIGNGITTVEDLAAFPDSNLAVIGMDGRYLRDMARGWIKEAKDKGTVAKELADANVKIQNQETLINSLNERLQALEAQQPRRGRPPKNLEAVN